MGSTALYNEILGLETRTWQALQQSGRALTPFLAQDAIMQFPMGMKVTRDTSPSLSEVLHSEAFVPWKTFSLGRVDVTPVGPDGVVISYLANATRPSVEPERDPKDVPWQALCSSVWRLEHGKWLMCFHQQTLTS